MGKAPICTTFCNVCGEPALRLVRLDISKGIEVAFNEETQGEKRMICSSCFSTLDFKKRRRRSRKWMKLTEHKPYNMPSEEAPLFDH